MIQFYTLTKLIYHVDRSSEYYSEDLWRKYELTTYGIVPNISNEVLWSDQTQSSYLWEWRGGGGLACLRSVTHFFYEGKFKLPFGIEDELKDKNGNQLEKKSLIDLLGRIK